jgi:glycosyltransferase involved in cell wall biosynthesis
MSMPLGLSPVLSICIPSYNRSGLLKTLLEEMDRADFLPFPFEVIVSDNSSNDPGYTEIIKFKPSHYEYFYVRRSENDGSEINLLSAYRLSRGEFCVHLCDDDRLLAQEIAAIVERMRADPSIVATYSAWQGYDAVDGSIQFEPYEEVRVTRENISETASKIAGLAENGIFRTDALARSLYPTRIVYCWAALLQRLLLIGDVCFQSEPFYRLMARHKGEVIQRSRVSSRLGTANWLRITHGISVFHHWATGQPLYPGETTGWQAMVQLHLRNAMYDAFYNHQYVEAGELMNYASSLIAATYMTAEERGRIASLAALDAVHLAAADMAGVSSIQLFALGPWESPLREMMTRGKSDLELDSETPLHVAASNPGSVFVTQSDEVREELILAYNLRPGFVLSLESSFRAWGIHG